MHTRHAFRDILFLLLVLLFYATDRAMACELKVIWEPWEPYQYEDQDKRLTGLDVELLNAVAQQAECKINYIQRPWARALREIASGVLDMAPGASINAERQEYANFSMPYREEVVVLVARKGESAGKPLTSLADMPGLKFRLGVTRDYYNGPDYEELMKNPAFASLVEEVSATEQNFHKLSNKRIDGFLVDPVVAKHQARQLGMTDKIEVHPLSISRDGIYFMFSKKSVPTELVERFNSALTAIKASGVHQNILERYGL